MASALRSFAIDNMTESSFQRSSDSDNFTEPIFASEIPFAMSDNISTLYSTTSTPFLTKFHNGGLITIVLLFMLAMGCDMKFSQIKSHIRNPTGVIIGMICQFLIMPLYGFGLVQVLGVHGFFGTGILLVSCCPGGSISNILTYLSNGEIALSVTMTTISTAIALGMMPLNMWIYGHGIDTEDVVIPYGGITFSLVLITAPVGLGMIIKWKYPTIAPYITKIGGAIGFIIILGLGIMEIVLYYRLYIMAPLPLYLSCFCLMPLGYVTGYCIMWIFKQDCKLRRTVGIECGVQNAALATTIASLSFEHPGQLQVRLFPVIYSIAQAIIGFAAIGIYKALPCSKDDDSKSTDSDIAVLKKEQYLSELEKNHQKDDEVEPLPLT